MAYFYLHFYYEIKYDSVNAAAQTWIMVEYDIKKVLVPPSDIKFIFLEERQQHFLPPQPSCSHVILEGNIQQQNINRLLH